MLVGVLSHLGGFWVFVRWFVILFKCNKSWLNVLKVFFMKAGWVCVVSLACFVPFQASTLTRCTLWMGIGPTFSNNSSLVNIVSLQC
jgi:hypothetical protein